MFSIVLFQKSKKKNDTEQKYDTGIKTILKKNETGPTQIKFCFEVVRYETILKLNIFIT